MGTFLQIANQTRNYSRYIDQWLHNYTIYYELFDVNRRAFKKVYPHARVGVDCPMWPHAFSGHDWYRFMEDFDYFAPYGRGGEIIPLKQARSYKRPGQFIGLTYGGYLYMAFNRKEELTETDWQRWRLWNGLFQGFTSIWWYQLTPPGNECNLGPGFEPYPSLRTASREIAKIRAGYYTLLRRLQRDYGPVAMHDSIRSRLVASALPPDFSTGSYGRNMDMHIAMHILENILSYQYKFVSDRQIPRGVLRGYKLLVMPLSVSIGTDEARALREFVEGGGVLLADVRPGIFLGNGKWDDNQRVHSIFGLRFKKELGRKLINGSIRGEFLGEAVEISPAQPFPADPAVEIHGAKPLCAP